MSLLTGGREPVILRSQSPMLTRHRHASRPFYFQFNLC